MPRLPVVSGRESIRAFEGLGYEVSRTRGSHVRLLCSGRPSVTIPLHRELDRGTLSAILDEAGLTVEEFLKLLRRKA